jgi:SAM-dependent methyltransferase
LTKPETALCPLCNGPLVERFRIPHVWHQPPTSRAFDIHWCVDCDFGYLLPRPSPQELALYYGREYFDRYGRTLGLRPADEFFAAARPTLFDRLRVRLAWALDAGTAVNARTVHTVVGSRPAAICDIGCGNGDLLASLRELGHDVVGVEPDEDARRNARERGLRVCAGSAERLPPTVSERRFDAAVMAHVLEHCLDPVSAIRNAAGLLGDDGWLIVEVPNADSISARRSGVSWFHTDAGRHVNFFTVRSLARIAGLGSLCVTRWLYGAYTVQFSNERMLAEQEIWDCLYTRKRGWSTGQRSRRASRLGLWWTLALSAFAGASKRYDVVGFVACKRPTCGSQLTAGAGSL